MVESQEVSRQPDAACRQQLEAGVAWEAERRDRQPQVPRQTDCRQVERQQEALQVARHQRDRHWQQAWLLVVLLVVLLVFHQTGRRLRLQMGRRFELARLP